MAYNEIVHRYSTRRTLQLLIQKMARNKNIDRLLADWPYDPENAKVRVVRGVDGRDVIQMRIDMGLLQLETRGRPDGTRPHSYETYFDYLLSREQRDEGFELSERQCVEVDREFVQFYHRRICWLTLKEYDRALADADHTLALMDFCADHSPDDHWTMSHEQYRPYVMFHRIQAAALSELAKDSPEAAVHQLNLGLDQLQDLFSEHDAGEIFEEHELVARLTELRESLRDHFRVGRTLQEQLQDAVAREEYELAARIRDELARRNLRSHP
jgi:hypothetical protein